MSDRRVHALVLLLAVAGVLAGCGGSGTHFGGGQANTVPVTVSMTDTPPAGVSVLSLQVTITDARLNPGNVELLAAPVTPVTVDLARLQTESSLLSAVNVAPGTYTSLALTIALNPSLTFQNNGAPLTVGGVLCATGSICKAGLTTANDSQSVSFPGAGITLAGSTPAALLIDANLSDLLSNAANTISMDLSVNGALTASQIVPQQGAPFETLEDVVGVVSAPANGAFVLQTALGKYNVTTNSSTQFLNFSSGGCGSASFTCITASQIVSVNMSLQSNNTLIATDIFFEDNSTALPEIEGVVVATGGLPAQFSMVVLQETPASSGPVLGSQVTVALNATPFAIDNLVGTLNTAGFSFASTADMIVGQEVSVQQGAGSTASVIQASRVLLRSSRITGTVAITVTSPKFTMNGLPAFLQNASPAITQIVFEAATTFTPNGTEFSGSAVNISQIAIGKSVSVRGQLFMHNGSPTLLASRVVQH